MSAQETAAPPDAPVKMPTTPELAHTELPDAQEKGEAEAPAASGALTPPPSSQHHRNKIGSPTGVVLPRISFPAINTSQFRDRTLQDEGSLEDMRAQVESASAEDLRQLATQLAEKLHEAKQMAAHFKLQHQMSQMESGEAVERMAVEMEMAKREIEVLQVAETNAKLEERSKGAASLEQANFRQVHNDIYDAMCDEIRDVKTQNAHLEHELAHTRRAVAQQENEIASLNDKVSLMRDRMRESREQLFRYRKQSGIESTPRTNKGATPYQTPARDRYTAPFETPSRTHHSERQYDQPQSASRQERQHQQPGFAALLQATDMVSQRAHSPTRQYRPHSQASESTPSLPSTPSKPPRSAPHVLYTPQPTRQMPREPPNTAPIPRKRGRETMTPPPLMRDFDSDGTVSARDEDSEAETEVAPGTTDVGSSLLQRERYGGPVIKRAKSAVNMRNTARAQESMYAPPVPQRSMEHGDGTKEWEERRREDDARLGIQRSQRV